MRLARRRGLVSLFSCSYICDFDANIHIALITISTRASLKKYHTYNLVLGMGERGDEWEFQRIGTQREKMHVERELQELRERLAQVETWKSRREEIEKELAKVWVEGGDEISPPPYVEAEESPAQDDGGVVDDVRTEETQSEAETAELVSAEEY